jgi:hypothetical protein
MLHQLAGELPEGLTEFGEHDVTIFKMAIQNFGMMQNVMKAVRLKLLPEAHTHPFPLVGRVRVAPNFKICTLVKR